MAMVLGMIVMLLAMNPWNIAMRWTCRRSKRRPDLLKRAGIDKIYKTATGTKIDTERNCRHWSHLDDTQKDNMALTWCGDCRKAVFGHLEEMV